MPVISVIVPIYNTEKYLNQCLDSILVQTFRDFEVILVDDGSPDNCGTICDEYAAKDSRVRVIHQSNAGVSTARNIAMKYAKGEYILFVDSDDLIHPDCLSELYTLMVTQNADIVFGRRTQFDSGDPISFDSSPEAESTIISAKGFFECGQERRFVTDHLFRRELIKNIEFDKNVSLGEDAIFNYTFLAEYPNSTIVLYNKELYWWRRRENSAFRSKGGNQGFCTIGEWCLDRYQELITLEDKKEIGDMLLLEGLKELLLFRYQGFPEKEAIQTCRKQLKRGASYLLDNPRLSVKNKVCYALFAKLPLSYSLMRWLRDELGV